MYDYPVLDKPGQWVYVTPPAVVFDYAVWCNSGLSTFDMSNNTIATSKNRIKALHHFELIHALVHHNSYHDNKDLLLVMDNLFTISIL